ncbi:hypothetical protein IQ227_05955 [Anabaena aphanizomenioides LEGE 00250]|uniref:Uncharacterized protein n=1 Tax=Sphaerospermopsis aphanizomenoides LEGE 00250 TaxID=2777972 RepID=A0ABR9VAR3_9CYAN|nr:hypothetical protein [Sphaerospermopsis aphanizomenoides]MBE9235593.1 hypothetical protein [Sphaerospermopsis aphanizomenoides LEGE 00250]
MRATTPNVHTKPPTPRYSPSVPVSVYRELVAELQAVQAKLDVVTNHNQKLSQENQQLRQEINKLVQSCLELQKLIDSSAPSSHAPSSHAPSSHAPSSHAPSSQTQPSTPISHSTLQNHAYVNNTQNNAQNNKPNNQTIPIANANVKNTSKPQPKGRKKIEGKLPKKKMVKTAPSPRQPTPKPPKKVRREVVSVPVMDMNFPVSEPMYIEEQEVHYYLPLESESRGLNGWWLFFTIVFIMIGGFSAGYLIVRPFLQIQSQNSNQ